jgi:hypothetical protein
VVWVLETAREATVTPYGAGAPAARTPVRAGVHRATSKLVAAEHAAELLNQSRVGPARESAGGQPGRRAQERSRCPVCTFRSRQFRHEADPSGTASLVTPKQCCGTAFHGERSSEHRRVLESLVSALSLRRREDMGRVTEQCGWTRAPSVCHLVDNMWEEAKVGVADRIEERRSSTAICREAFAQPGHRRGRLGSMARPRHVEPPLQESRAGRHHPNESSIADEEVPNRLFGQLGKHRGEALPRRPSAPDSGARIENAPSNRRVGTIGPYDEFRLQRTARRQSDRDRLSDLDRVDRTAVVNDLSGYAREKTSDEIAARHGADGMAKAPFHGSEIERHQRSAVGKTECQLLNSSAEVVETNPETLQRPSAVGVDGESCAAGVTDARSFQHLHLVSGGHEATRQREPTNARPSDSYVHCCPTHRAVNGGFAP